MRGRSFSERAGQAGRVLVAHGVHVCGLLLPTLLLAGPQGVDWTVGCFALAVTAAAVMESLVVSPPASHQFAAPHHQEAVVQDPLAIRVALVVGLVMLLAFWSAQFEYYYLGVPAAVLQIIGATLMAAGVLLRVAAILALGSHFVSDIRIGPTAVRQGIYRWLRHPSEIGLLLIAVAAPLLIGAVFTAGAAALLLLPIAWWRIRREEVAWAGQDAALTLPTIPAAAPFRAAP